MSRCTNQSSFAAPRAASDSVKALILAVIVLSSARTAPASQPPHLAPAADSGIAPPQQIIKRFDFNERSLGNYEALPMYWERLSGPGLPRYSEGRFDDALGHEAPPSFVFSLKGGNICYEYRGDDLRIVPNSDYDISAYVRFEDISLARAFIGCFLVDQDGQQIEGSQRISALEPRPHERRAARGGDAPRRGGPSADPLQADSTADAEPTSAEVDDGGWVALHIQVPSDYAGAAAIRLQLWVVQPQVWQARPEAAVDAIFRQDVRGKVWFDDIELRRRPRVRLGFSRPGNFAEEGEPAALTLSVQENLGGGAFAELAVTDAGGGTAYSTSLAVPAAENSALEAPLPELPPGLYEASSLLRVRGRELQQRRIQFAILPELGAEAGRSPALGIDLGTAGAPDVAGAAALTAAIGCGSVKLTTLAPAQEPTPTQVEELRHTRDLLRALAIRRIEGVGVIAVPDGGDPRRTAARDYLSDIGSAGERFGRLMSYFGGSVPIWQLGSEPVELTSGGGWDAATVARVRREMERFISLPELVVPASVFDAAHKANQLHEILGSPGGDEPGAAGGLPSGVHHSVWAPAGIPARSLAWQLAFLQSADSSQSVSDGELTPGAAGDVWLRIDPDRSELLSTEAREIDLARRIVVAACLSPTRLYVPAPFACSDGGGLPAWAPSEEIFVVRTLYHYLGGKRAVRALRLGPESVGVVFAGKTEQCLIAWTWTAGQPVECDILVGPAAAAVDARGQRQSLAVGEGAVRATLTQMPLIITDVNLPLMLMRSECRLSPQYIELHVPTTEPVLALRNTFDAAISGRLDITPPPEWTLPQTGHEFQLGPGETFERALPLMLPSRKLATQEFVDVRVNVKAPTAATLKMRFPLTLGLRDVQLDAQAQWSGDDLVVRQSFRNLSSATVSFTSYCQAAGRPRAEGAFLNVPAGELREQIYQFNDARSLSGSVLALGIQEVRGQRVLDQLVDVP
ncbi:hypothetical protein RAS1_18900 [Phycisphaerae bacterium RAS1]|nr:hypothetical protein RAS1_18900 [Phycisphaerae bacterium RAS1]